MLDAGKVVEQGTNEEFVREGDEIAVEGKPPEGCPIGATPAGGGEARPTLSQRREEQSRARRIQVLKTPAFCRT